MATCDCEDWSVPCENDADGDDGLCEPCRNDCTLASALADEIRSGGLAVRHVAGE